MGFTKVIFKVEGGLILHGDSAVGTILIFFLGLDRFWHSEETKAANV